MRQQYVHAARDAVALVAHPAVAAAWEGPSALPGFTVGGLAAHLAQQVLRVPGMLDAPVPDGDPIPVVAHYARAAWRDGDPHSPANAAIRDSGEELAAAGPQALAARVRAAVDALAAQLPQCPGEAPVHLPWGPWSLTLDDFLLTRLLEIAVHRDDLAVSVGAEVADLPESVVAPVLALLTRLAVDRHGPTPVLRALSRAERAPATVSAF